jgi:hypothetical protein
MLGIDLEVCARIDSLPLHGEPPCVLHVVEMRGPNFLNGTLLCPAHLDVCNAFCHAGVEIVLC